MFLVCEILFLSPAIRSSKPARKEEDSKASIPEIAKAKLYERVVENNLDPAIELEITFMDKIIFIVTIIIIRTIALFITNYFIDNGTIIVIQQAIKYYTINYLIVFLILFLMGTLN